MKFKNVSKKTINVKYNGMITIQPNEVADLPATYARVGLEQVTEKVKVIKEVKPKNKKSIFGKK